MNWADVIASTIIYTLGCTLQANYQAKQFERVVRISHFWHGVYYGALCFAFGLAYVFGVSWQDGIAIGLYGGLVRLAFFDTILNLIRGKPLLYNDNDADPESLMDWWENRILRINQPGGMRRLLILKICYLIIWAAYIPLIFYVCN